MVRTGPTKLQSIIIVFYYAITYPLGAISLFILRTMSLIRQI